MSFGGNFADLTRMFRDREDEDRRALGSDDDDDDNLTMVVEAGADGDVEAAVAAELTTEELVEEAFRHCDWERTDERSGKRYPRTMYEYFQGNLIDETGALNAARDDDGSKRRAVFTATRDYPGSEHPGTLLHMLCDYKDGPMGEFSAAYGELVSLLTNAEVTQLALEGEERMLDVNAARDHDRQTPLFRAVARGNLACVSALLRARSATNVDDETGQPLRLVDLEFPCGGHDGLPRSVQRRDTARTALQQALRVAAEGEPGLAGSSVEGAAAAEDKQQRNPEVDEAFMKIIVELLRAGANAHVDESMTLVADVVDMDMIEALSAALEREDVDPNRQRADGRSPLLNALEKSRKQSTDLLAAHPRVDLNARVVGDEGKVKNSTVLIEAMRRYHRPNGRQMLKMLLGAQDEAADVNLVNARGESCASLALDTHTEPKLDAFTVWRVLDMLCGRRNPAILTGLDLGDTLFKVLKIGKKQPEFRHTAAKLIERGKADVNKPDFKLLDFVIKSDDEDSEGLVRLLLDHGADVTQGPASTSDPPLRAPSAMIRCFKLVLEREDELRRVSRDRGFEKDKKAQKKFELFEAKLQELAAHSSEPVRRLKDNEGRTAMDYLLDRHDAAVRELESDPSDESSFWARVRDAPDDSSSSRGASSPEGGGSGGAGTLALFREKLEALEAARKEVQKWGPRVEAGPKKRTEYLARLARMERRVKSAAARYEVWDPLHRALRKFETKAEPAPPLAGFEWEDMKEELSYRQLDDGTSGDQELEGAADAGLTQMEDWADASDGFQRLEKEYQSESIQELFDKLGLSKHAQEFIDDGYDLETILDKNQKTGERFFTEEDLPDELEATPAEVDRLFRGIEKEIQLEKKPVETPEDGNEEGGDGGANNKGGDSDSDSDSDSDDEEPVEFVLGLEEVPRNIEFTRYAFNWIKREDPSRVNMAMKKIALLAEGPKTWGRAYQLSKVLKGQVNTPMRYPIREAKLDSGMRILWQERRALEEYGVQQGGTVLIWYIVKHDAISSKLEAIDRCFNRMAKESQLSMNAALAGRVSGQKGSEDEGSRHEIIPEVLLDPLGNTPLMVYDVMVSELPDLQKGWQPPMRLTSGEKEIVDKDGLVTILGRSGTGKTLCMAMRMLKDLERAAGIEDFRQIFVARSVRLCRQVKRLVEQGGHKQYIVGRKEAAEGGSGSGGGAAAAAAAVHNSSELPDAINRKFVPTVDYFQAVEEAIDFSKIKHVRHMSFPVAGRVATYEFQQHFWKGFLSAQMQRGFGQKKTSREEQRKIGAALGANVDATTVWTQINSIIKGSVEAAWGEDGRDEARAARAAARAAKAEAAKAKAAKGDGGGAEASDEDDFNDEDEDGGGGGGAAAEANRTLRTCGTPITEEEYLKMPSKRVNLSKEQRRVVFQYFEVYQDWLRTESKC